MVVNPLTVFYDERCKRWCQPVAVTGMWRFVARRDVERALEHIDEFVTVATLFAGFVNQCRLQPIKKLRLMRYGV